MAVLCRTRQAVTHACTKQTEISQRVEEKVDKDRRRFLLMEQLKYIKKELGIEKDDTSSVVERYDHNEFTC